MEEEERITGVGREKEWRGVVEEEKKSRGGHRRGWLERMSSLTGK